MDGIHDFGGKEGFGPVDAGETGEGFHENWEGRVYGVVRSISRPDDWSADWFRFCRELIDPMDYLSRPYYDQWLQTYAAMLVNDELATVAEIASGKMESPAVGLPSPAGPETVPDQRFKPKDHDVPSEPAPAYGVGDEVRTKTMSSTGHTRLPAYARGKVGVVEIVYGHHILPDASAAGEPRTEPLYTVVFKASDLWPESGASQDTISLDLWESYFDAPDA